MANNLRIGTDIIVVDTISALTALLEGFSKLPLTPPSLYIDLEGIKLGRLGSVSVLSIYVLPKKKTYLIDIHALDKEAFTAPNKNGDTLKFILEHPDIPKVFFDVRNDSAALFHHYKIRLNCAKDIQVMELALRKGGKDFLAGLAKCIDKDAPISAEEKIEWRYLKDRVVRLCDPSHGGTYEVFNERPMFSEIAQYCAQDVALMPLLWKQYASKLNAAGQAFWRSKVKSATKQRVEESQKPGYDGHDADKKVRGPWKDIQGDLEEWNDQVLDASINGESFPDYDSDI